MKSLKNYVALVLILALYATCCAQAQTSQDIVCTAARAQRTSVEIIHHTTEKDSLKLLTVNSHQLSVPHKGFYGESNDNDASLAHTAARILKDQTKSRLGLHFAQIRLLPFHDIWFQDADQTTRLHRVYFAPLKQLSADNNYLHAMACGNLSVSLEDRQLSLQEPHDTKVLPISKAIEAFFKQQLSGQDHDQNSYTLHNLPEAFIPYYERASCFSDEVLLAEHHLWKKFSETFPQGSNALTFRGKFPKQIDALLKEGEGTDSHKAIDMNYAQNLAEKAESEKYTTYFHGMPGQALYLCNLATLFRQILFDKPQDNLSLRTHDLGFVNQLSPLSPSFKSALESVGESHRHHYGLGRYSTLSVADSSNCSVSIDLMEKDGSFVPVNISALFDEMAELYGLSFQFEDYLGLFHRFIAFQNNTNGKNGGFVTILHPQHTPNLKFGTDDKYYIHPQTPDTIVGHYHHPMAKEDESDLAQEIAQCFIHDLAQALQKPQHPLPHIFLGLDSQWPALQALKTKHDLPRLARQLENTSPMINEAMVKKLLHFEAQQTLTALDPEKLPNPNRLLFLALSSNQWPSVQFVQHHFCKNSLVSALLPENEQNLILLLFKEINPPDGMPEDYIGAQFSASSVDAFLQPFRIITEDDPVLQHLLEQNFYSTVCHGFKQLLQAATNVIEKSQKPSDTDEQKEKPQNKESVLSRYSKKGGANPLLLALHNPDSETIKNKRAEVVEHFWSTDTKSPDFKKIVRNLMLFEHESPHNPDLTLKPFKMILLKLCDVKPTSCKVSESYISLCDHIEALDPALISDALETMKKDPLLHAAMAVSMNLYDFQDVKKKVPNFDFEVIAGVQLSQLYNTVSSIFYTE